MSNVIIKDNLYVGIPELNRIQSLLQKAITANTEAMIKQHGLMLHRPTNLTWSDDWKVLDGGSIVTINAGKAFLHDTGGVTRTIISTQAISAALPAQDGTYGVFLRYKALDTEAGTISITNNATAVVGVGTEFKSIFRQYRKLIVGGVAYAISSVTDEQHLTLAAPYTDGTIVAQSFSAGGWFSNTPSVSGMKIYSYDGFEIVIQAGETLSGAVLLATMVILTGAITTLTDRRNESVFQLYSDWGSEPEKQNVITTNTTIETDTTKAKTFRLTDYAGNDTFVTADLSGVQHIKYPAKSGILVVSDYSPTMPVLPRIGSVECARDRSHNVNVLLRWNFDNCRGTVLGNHFNMTDASGGMGTIQANALAGLFLEIDNITYGIISNLVTSAGTTVITFGTIYGGAIDLPNMTISSDNRAHITSGCTSYDIFAISNSGQYYEYSATVGVDLGHIAQAIMLTLKNGVDYTFEVRATTPAEKTSWASFVVTATLPNITADGTVDVQGGVSGTAIIAIGGWATAESFLISYSSTANASFYDEHSTTIESFERRVSIPYASNNDLDVLVKPMQSGQVVGTEVQAMMGQIQYSDMIGAPAVQRDKFAIPFGFSNNDGGLAKFAGINFVGGIPMPRSGCITKVRFTTTLGAVKSLSTAFVDPPVGQGAPASNRFTDTGKVSIEFNAVDSLWYPIIDGQQCPEMILAYQPAEGVGDGFIEGGILYGEFDND